MVFHSVLICCLFGLRNCHYKKKLKRLGPQYPTDMSSNISVDVMLKDHPGLHKRS